MKRFFSPLVLFITCTTHFFAQNRVVLIEQFTNSSCPPCGAVSPSIYAFANSNSDVAVVAYHTLFPYNNDSMYFENPTEATQRVNFYSINAVPYSVLDGNAYNGSTNPFAANISAHVDNRKGITPRYNIDVSSLLLTENQLSGLIKFSSSDAMNASENLVAHVVIIEKNVLKSAYVASPGANSELEFGYVMRKMIPDAFGTNLVNKNLHESDSISLSWVLNHIKDRSQLRIVAFVQNATTKEVYQAQIFSISGTPTSINETRKNSCNVVIYPNPAQKRLTLSLGMTCFVHSLSVINESGIVKYFKRVEENTNNIFQELDLTNGVYSLKIQTSNGDIFKKLVIVN